MQSNYRAIPIARLVVGIAALSYVAAVTTLLPPHAWPHMLAGAAFVVATVTVVARALKDREPTGWGLMLIQFGAGAVLVMPTVPAMGGVGGVAIPIAFCATTAAGMLWASLRWAGRIPHRKPLPLTRAMLLALSGALALSAIATVGLTLGHSADPEKTQTLAWIYVSYFGGAAAAALTSWGLRGLANQVLGRYMIGALGGACMYGAVGPVVALADKKPIDPPALLAMALVLGVLVGPPVAFNYAASHSDV